MVVCNSVCSWKTAIIGAVKRCFCIRHMIGQFSYIYETIEVCLEVWLCIFLCIPGFSLVLRLVQYSLIGFMYRLGGKNKERLLIIVIKTYCKMDAIWNKPKIQHPPYLTWRINKKAFDVKKFLATISKAIRELEAMGILDVEAAFLSRLIYRMKNKFRSDKGLKCMEKINKALINYLNMGLVDSYKDLKSYIYVEDKMLTLPSRQLLEYVLVRTQGFAKLMERIEQVARYSGHFLKTRIGLGHAWSITLIAYANVSRIWFLSRQLIRQCCIWYKELYQYLPMFQYIGLPWIPENQSLPHDLKQWLSIEWMYNENIRTCRKDVLDDMIFKLLSKHPIDCTDEAIAIPESSTTCELIASQKDILTHVSEDKSMLFTDMDDVGEVINRETFEASLPKLHEHDTKTFSVKKRKRAHINDDVRMTEELENKKKKEVISEDIIEDKLGRSKRRKKHKRKLFSNANICKTVVTPNVKVTNKMRKRKKKLEENSKRNKF